MTPLRLLNQQAFHGFVFGSSMMVQVYRLRNVSAFSSPFIQVLMVMGLAWLFARELSMRIKDESGLKELTNTEKMLSLLALALSLCCQPTHTRGEGCLSIWGIMKYWRILPPSAFQLWRNCHESKGQTHSYYR